MGSLELGCVSTNEAVLQCPDDACIKRHIERAINSYDALSMHYDDVVQTVLGPGYYQTITLPTHVVPYAEADVYTSGIFIARHCEGGDTKCLEGARRGLAASLGVLALDFVPVAGDVKGVLECWDAPDLSSCAGAILSIVPVGDLIQVVAKHGDETFSAIFRKKDGGEGGGGKGAGSAPNNLPNPPSLTISNSQWGAKSAQHMRDFDLDVSNPAHRQQFRDMVESIGLNPDRVVTGTFSGGGPAGRRDVLFYVRGNDVVVTSPVGEFVTVLQNGITNLNVIRALGQ